MYKQDLRLFDVAKSVSKTSDYGRISIGAILVSGKEIVSAAANAKKSHPEQRRLNRLRFDDQYDSCKNSIHAEMRCILNCRDMENIRGMKLYVYREDRVGHLANCRPCPACMEKIREVGIRDIYYTTYEGYVHEHLIY